MFRHKLWTVLTLLVIIAMLASCAPQVVKETVIVEKPVEKVVKETVVVEKEVAPPPAPASGQVVIPMTNMAVARALHPVSAHYELGLGIEGQVVETLVWLNPNDLSIEPRLATDWEFSNDGKVITFHLREGVKFSNGDSFSAADVEANWEVLKAAEMIESPFSNWLVNLHKVDIKVVDDMTVQMIMPETNPAILELLCRGLFIGPKGPMLADKNNIEGSRLQRYPIGTGPYVVKEHEGDDVILEANPDYWGEKARIKTVIFRSMGDAVGLAAAMRAGEGDLANFDAVTMGGLDADSRFYSMKSPELRGCMFHAKPDLSTPFMQDERVRWALAYAINRDNIIKTVFNGWAVPIGYWRGEGLPLAGHSDPIPYDPEKGEALMIEAGFTKNAQGIWTKDGEVFKLTFSNIPAKQRMTNLNILVAADLKEFGIEIGDFHDYPDYSSFKKTTEDRKREVYCICTGQNLWNASDWSFSINAKEAAPLYYFMREGYTAPDNIRALVEQMFTTMDPQKQEEIADKYIAESQKVMLPHIPLVSPVGGLIVKKELRGVNLNAMPGVTGWMLRIRDWYWAE